MDAAAVYCVLGKISKEADKSAYYKGKVDESNLVGGESVDIAENVRETADLDV